MVGPMKEIPLEAVIRIQKLQQVWQVGLAFSCQQPLCRADLWAIELEVCLKKKRIFSVKQELKEVRTNNPP